MTPQPRRLSISGHGPLLSISAARAALALAAASLVGGVLLTGTAAGAHPLPDPTIRRHELIVRGTDWRDLLALRLSAADPTLLEVDFGDDGDAEFEFDRTGFDRIEVRALGGDDAIRIDDTNGVFTDTEVTTLIGGGGADSITGGGGVERFFGGAGPDFVDGGGANDSAWLGGGDDQFQWDPGEGNDLVEGMHGDDTMLFNGSSGDERFETAPNAGRVRFTRDLGNIVMDLDDVEQIDLDTLDGRDSVVVRELSGTDLIVFNADLEVTKDSAVGDAQTDFLTLFGTDGDDHVTVSGAAGSATITGAVPTITITHAVLPDVMQVLGLAGDDSIDASALDADAIGYGTSGHDGDDRLLGGDGADSLDGGAGTDFVDGGRADDSAFMGPGDDTFQWDPGEGSDIVGGEDGHDTMLFNGSDQNEAFVTAADGFGGAVFTRDLGNIVMSLDRVEQIDLDALGGADTVLIDDLSDFRGTGLETINTEVGAGDGQADAVTVNGTASSFLSDGADSITVVGDAASVDIAGLPAALNVAGAEPIDSLVVNGLDGDDTIDATGLAGDILRFFANGDGGDDTLAGSPGDDTLDGGDGYDVLHGGAGDDVLLNGEAVSDD